jgi:hypothetical protein
MYERVRLAAEAFADRVLKPVSDLLHRGSAPDYPSLSDKPANAVGSGLASSRARALARRQIAVPDRCQLPGRGAAQQGITCNAVCPGYVYTPLVEAQIDAQAKAHSIPREKVIRDVLLGQQPNALPPLKNSARYRFFSPPTLLPQLQAPHYRSTAVGPRTENARALVGAVCPLSNTVAQSDGSRSGQ